ncbi:phosphoglycerate dehydrogenase [Sphaerimonospora sp. CA-214678]|uniref:phosphoglycerate dehydrogenase n=1 Tax=Sphaerimonospora sp. CA-214678 TaxID=3240029 RepID=UPI003D926720
MARAVTLITTPWLRDANDVHHLLSDAGIEVRYATRADQANVADVDAIIAGTEPIGEEVIQVAPRLRVISRTGVGYDNIDVEAATRRGIAVCATPGVNRRSVAEFTLALMLNVARQIPANSQALRSGAWKQDSGIELYGKTIGIVGFGAVGQTVSDLCGAFGMTVIATDPNVDEAVFAKHGADQRDLATLLAESDIVTLHLALNDDTRNIIDAKALNLMKPGAYLINAARGSMVDELALAEALNSGRLSGAALDTFAQEPLPASSPLLAVPNLVVTPHLAGSTVEGRHRSGLMAARSVIESINGGFSTRTVNLVALTSDPQGQKARK